MVTKEKMHFGGKRQEVPVQGSESTWHPGEMKHAEFDVWLQKCQG